METNENGTSGSAGGEAGGEAPRDAGPGRNNPDSPPGDGAQVGAEDEKDTRGRLIEVGRALMARNGFGGTSVRSITEQAGANLGAITYHFGSKQALYAAVLEDVLSPLRDQVQLLKEMPLSPLRKLEYFIRGLFQHLRENPDMPRFMVQEIVLGEKPAPTILELIGVTVPVLTGIIQEGQAVGTIRKGDPVLMAMSSISQPIYLSIMPPVLARAQRAIGGVPQPRSVAEDHAVDFVVRGLEARDELQDSGQFQGGGWTAWRSAQDAAEDEDQEGEE